jgi:hypothetical protein
MLLAKIHCATLSANVCRALPQIKEMCIYRYFSFMSKMEERNHIRKYYKVEIARWRGRRRIRSEWELLQEVDYYCWHCLCAYQGELSRAGVFCLELHVTWQLLCFSGWNFRFPFTRQFILRCMKMPGAIWKF